MTMYTQNEQVDCGLDEQELVRTDERLRRFTQASRASRKKVYIPVNFARENVRFSFVS